ncbi:MAG TPA: hypothetical protein DGF30_04180 [Desulfomicrobium sp.]|nr:hypothetical protein [Desulfomicrobium sp.]
MAVSYRRPPLQVKRDDRQTIPPPEERMQERLEDIEIKYLYLQKTVDELSSVVIEQQKEIRELRHLVTLLGRKLKDVSAMPPFDPDEKPPHY